MEDDKGGVLVRGLEEEIVTSANEIYALLEHLGHIPYRDSKLTRLLRDSLGGKTKMCIIATVLPSVLCLDETLSTLDYAYWTKSVKNKPEVRVWRWWRVCVQFAAKGVLVQVLQTDLTK